MLLKMVCILDSIHDPVLLLEQVFKTLGLNQVFIRAYCLSLPLWSVMRHLWDSHGFREFLVGRLNLNGSGEISRVLV